MQENIELRFPSKPCKLEIIRAGKSGFIVQTSSEYNSYVGNDVEIVISEDDVKEKVNEFLKNCGVSGMID